MRIALLLQASCLSCFILFFCLPMELHAQTGPQEYVAGFIQCSIEVETEIWSQAKPGFVTVKIKNISDKAVKLLGIYSFKLTSINDSDTLKRGIPLMTYWSPVNILSGTPLKLQAGKVPKGAIYLEPNETKVMKFELTKIFWNRSLSSIWPYQHFLEVVPKGTYDLVFDVETDRQGRPDNIPIVSHIASNKVRIVVE